MERLEVVTWLNHRNSLAKSGRVLGFEPSDINFFRNYIHHYKDKSIHLNDIIYSITHRPPDQILQYLDFICTKLVEDFNISIKTVKSVVTDPGFYISIGESPFHQREIEFIEEYS